MAQLKYQRAKQIKNQNHPDFEKARFLLAGFHCTQSALGMSHFSFSVEKVPIFKVLNLRKENFNRLILCYLSCTIPRPKFEKE